MFYSDNHYTLWGHGSFVQLNFASQGCRFRQAGYCTMCNYGRGDTPTPDEAGDIIAQIQKKWPCKIRRMLLGACGSIFDREEIPAPLFQSILDSLSETEIPAFIWETHYVTVTPDILAVVQETLPDRKHFIEMGLESSNENVLHNSLHKYMYLPDLAACVKQIHSFSFHPILNVFVGAPGLTTREQYDDALSSLRWAYSHGAEEVVLFPANIKPGTELYEDYRQHRYNRISHWLLIEILNSLTDEELSRTSVSWYGDRQEKGISREAVPPDDCSRCHTDLMRFYERYMSDFRADHRREALEEVCRKAKCGCCGEVRRAIYA